MKKRLSRHLLTKTESTKGESTKASTTAELTKTGAQKIKRKNTALLTILIGFAGLFYCLTMVKMKQARVKQSRYMPMSLQLQEMARN